MSQLIALLILPALFSAGCSRRQDARSVETPPVANEQPSAARRIVAEQLFLPNRVANLKFNFRVSPDVPLLRQTKANGCWATVATMIAGWRGEQRLEIEKYLQTVGGRYVSLYERDEGLRRGDKEAFLIDSGFDFEWGASYLPIGIEKLLRNYGPLWFTVSTGAEFSKHATIVVGLCGTGDMDATYVVYVDPKDGAEHASLYPDFMGRYEQIARESNSLADMREGYQVVHLLSPGSDPK
jgi:hypothetical protein